MVKGHRTVAANRKPFVDGGALEDEKRGECKPVASASETRGIETGPGGEGMAGTNRFMNNASA